VNGDMNDEHTVAGLAGDANAEYASVQADWERVRPLLQMAQGRRSRNRAEELVREEPGGPELR
jgi:hypothetical protein